METKSKIDDQKEKKMVNEKKGSSNKNNIDFSKKSPENKKKHQR